jgi:hypothetical protein
VINEDAKHMLEILWVEDQEPIETLRANGAHEPVMSHQWAEPSNLQFTPHHAAR